jgi:hypothetical protein
MTQNDHHIKSGVCGGGAVAAEPGMIYDADRANPQTAYTFAESYARSGRVIVAISSDSIGGSEADPGASDSGHGAELLRIFLENLCERINLPDEVVLYGRGVLLTGDGHPALDSIRLLCHREVSVKVCTESLDFYKTKPAEANVQPVPMSEITRSMMRADRVIRP